ncbi:MAG: hypothetical protein ABII21_01205 [bacterium]
MIDGNITGKEWEERVIQLFKQKDFEILRLESKGKNNPRIIDFYVHNKSLFHDGLLCEVKSINVSGFDEDINGQVSSKDKTFLEAISIDNLDNTKRTLRKHEYTYDEEGLIRDIATKLVDAQDQYNRSELGKFNIDKQKRPFVVILCFDYVFFQERINYRKILSDFTTISAIYTLGMDKSDEFIIYPNSHANILLEQKHYRC